MLAGAYWFDTTSPVPTPTTVAIFPAGLTRYVLNNVFKKSPPRITLPKTTFDLLFNHSTRERVPDTNRL